MKDFEAYLTRLGIGSGRNQGRMSRLLRPWLDWLRAQNLSLEAARYADLMDYLGHLQALGKSKAHQNRFLQSLTHYYRFRALPNLAQGVRIRGVIRSQPEHLLSEEELTRVYTGYEPQARRLPNAQSDQLILGLIIYQALDMQAFMHLEVQDLDLEKGRLYVRAQRHKQARAIPLEAIQVLSLHTFVHHIRPALLEEESDKLFAPLSENYNQLHGQFKHLASRVRQQAQAKANIYVEKLSRLRQSRIAIWAREEGLRKAQYLAGFRCVSSVERYQAATLDDLKAQVALHHPLERKG
ncbi:MAG: tyrosine-type recombinase/integrase [Bacteroidia bacterium]|nr:tyrosine-type recombinase/integrase [Bacteroidia bacterium]